MSLVIIGGHSRNVGKTSVVAGLIAALPEFKWTAMKITQFGHGICSEHGEPCDCALVVSEHSWSISEEEDRRGKSDTSRFLVSGAARSIWVRTRIGMLAEAMPALREAIASAENVIIESNSVLRFLRPDVYVSVLDYATRDFKDSAREYLDRADAIVLQNSDRTPAWDGVSLKPIAGKPSFPITPPDYVTSEIVEFVRGRLGERGG